MSDLASSCEYLTIEKLCSAVLESEKAKARRQERCQNEEKMTCCYVCSSRRECTTSCKFLGNTESQSASAVEAEKAKVENTVSEDIETEVPQTDKASVACCSSCNVEMSQTRTKFAINGWEGSHPRFAGDDSDENGEVLPVIVYLCPQCGKIEFRADIKH